MKQVQVRITNVEFGKNPRAGNRDGVFVHAWNTRQDKQIAPKFVFAKLPKGGDNPLYQRIKSELSEGVECTFILDDQNYWNLTDFQNVSGGSGGQSSPPTPGGGNKTSGGGGKGLSGQFRKPEEISRTECLVIAERMVANAMGNAEQFGKVFKKTLTFDLIRSEVLSTAGELVKFVEGKLDVGAPEASTGDLNSPGANAPDDDIPY